jgi:hypothetical protein
MRAFKAVSKVKSTGREAGQYTFSTIPVERVAIRGRARLVRPR